VTERRIGQGFDVHAFADGRALVLGGVTVEHDRGLAGHSDADVLLHAITDAVLGAAGLGDIGEHFPDTDPRWKDASSVDLLRHVMDLVSGAGWRVVNGDATVIAQEPRLTPVKAAIRESVAGLLGVPVDRVNVKAKTAERLGPIGRCEGIEAQAIVLIERDDV
jgi:2-C-methyl-D-erythritol 2,4-cyclodiphosphate synthase